MEVESKLGDAEAPGFLVYTCDHLDVIRQLCSSLQFPSTGVSFSSVSALLGVYTNLRNLIQKDRPSLKPYTRMALHLRLASATLRLGARVTHSALGSGTMRTNLTTCRSGAEYVQVYQSQSLRTRCA